MPSKNDLSAYKNLPHKKVLKKEETKIKKEFNTPKMGRPAKPMAQKETFKLTLSLTEEEGARIAKKAGITPLAAYVKHFIRSNTDLLK